MNMSRRRMTYVEARYRGERDYWRDASGNRCYHRAGGGVAHDPYIYQWDTPAASFKALVDKLLAIEALHVEIVLRRYHTMVVRARVDASVATFPGADSRPVRKINIRFRDDYRNVASAMAVGTNEEIMKCDFSSLEAISEFVAEIEAEFVRQKLAMPPL